MHVVQSRRQAAHDKFDDVERLAVVRPAEDIPLDFNIAGFMKLRDDLFAASIFDDIFKGDICMRSGRS
jgi:hypothetical protein